MIKIAKQVDKILKTIEEKGHECYVSGECVRYGLLGHMPIDWDVITDMSLEEMKEMFPQGQVVNDELAIIRLNLEPENPEGIIVDICHYKNGNGLCDSMEEDLKGRTFTCDAMAESLDRKLFDPFSGRRDMQEKVIRTVDDPMTVFEENPEKMVEMVRIAAEMYYEIGDDEMAALKEKGHLVLEKNQKLVGEQLKILLISDAGKEAYRNLSDTGLLNCLLGRPVDKKLSIREKNEVFYLLKNFNMAEEDADLRLGLFYLCFDKKETRDIIRIMEFGEPLTTRLLTLHEQINHIYGIKTRQVLKEFINKVGAANYNYMNKVTRSRKRIYSETSNSVNVRRNLWILIKENGEVALPSHLPFTAKSLVEDGIAANAQDAESIVYLVLDEAFKKDMKIEDEEQLLALAKSFAAKGKLSTKKIKWIKD